MPFISSMRATEGPVGGGLHRSSECVVDIFPAVNGRTRYFLDRETLPIPTTGEYKVYPVYQMGYRPIKAKAWGAGGAGSNSWPYQSPGGGGGYAAGTLSATGDAFTAIVGQGGRSSNTAETIVIGGGATSAPQGSTGDRQYSGGGGGFSGLMSGTATVHSVNSPYDNNYRLSATRQRSILIAGGGGGGGNGYQPYWARMDGGAGGGTEGESGYWANGYNSDLNYRATQSRNANSYAENGTGWVPTYSTIWPNLPREMCAMTGAGGSYGGGGGGGYYGGSCYGGGNSWPLMGQGQGGSGYIHPTLISNSTLTMGSLRTPPNTGDSMYVSGKGFGGTAAPGTGTHADSGLLVLFAF